MLLRARVVVPVSQPPIDNGAVLVSGSRICAVGPWREISKLPHRRTIDLGKTVLLPGLVNAHCHLDYTGMAGRFEPPRQFTDWIKQITTEKSHWSDDDFRESWLRGAQMLLRTGTTTVGDVEAVSNLLPSVWDAMPLRVFSFLEMTGIRSRRQPRAVLDEALKRLVKLKHPRCKTWLSPHATYSTLPELLRLSAGTTRRHHWRMTTHVAESDQEFEMFMHARGEMHDWLKRNERDNADCGLGSPVQHMERCGALSPALLAIHANYLAPGDAELLGRRGAHVVHCPRSHAYFRHQPFPFGVLQAADVNISIATDSLASVIQIRRQNVELNLFDEMREFRRAFPAVSPESVLRMVTINPARALGLAGRIGELCAGAFADIIAVPMEGRRSELFDNIIQQNRCVTASLIGGRWAVPPPSA